jgi:hypothetical protein
MRDHVLRTAALPRRLRRPSDLVVGALQVGHEIGDHEKRVQPQLKLRQATHRRQRIVKTIQVEQIECPAGIGGCQVGIEEDGLVRLRDGQLVLASAAQGEPRDQYVRIGIARVALDPRLQRPLLPFQVAGDVAVVQCFDVEALDVADAIAQLVRPERALPRERRLSHDAVAEAEVGMAHRKTGIDGDRTLQERLRAYPAE